MVAVYFAAASILGCSMCASPPKDFEEYIRSVGKTVQRIESSIEDGMVRLAGGRPPKQCLDPGEACRWRSDCCSEDCNWAEDPPVRLVCR